MNVLYSGIIAAVIGQEMVNRSGQDVKIPTLPADVTPATQRMFEAMQAIQGLSDNAVVWILQEDVKPDTIQDMQNLGGELLKIYVDLALLGDANFDSGYDDVYRILMNDLYLWMMNTLKLDSEYKCSKSEGSDEMHEKLHMHLKKVHRTMCGNYMLGSLSAQWAFDQMSQWFNLESNFKQYHVISCNRGFMYNVGDGELSIAYLSENDSGNGDVLRTHRIDTNGSFDATHSTPVSHQASAEDVQDWLYHEY